MCVLHLVIGVVLMAKVSHIINNNRPLDGLIVTVKFLKVAHFRMWLTLQCLKFGVWISGAQLRVDDL